MVLGLLTPSIESEQQTQFSCGPVSSDEKLIRFLFYPLHVDKDGELKPQAITSQDLRERGYSVYRKLYVTDKKLQNIVQSCLDKNPSERYLSKIALLICYKVRNIKAVTGEQAFYVIDDAKDVDNEAHAKIMCSRHYPDGDLKMLKERLISCMCFVGSVGSIRITRT